MELVLGPFSCEEQACLSRRIALPNINNETTGRRSESAYICQVNLKGSRDSGHAPIRKFCKGSCPDCPWEHAHQI